MRTLFLIGLSCAFANGDATVHLAAQDAAWSPLTARLYASVPTQNAIAVVDPVSASIESNIPLPGAPSRVVVSSDGLYIFVAVAGPQSVVRINVTTGLIQAQVIMPDPMLAIVDLAPMPTQTDTVAVTMAYPGISGGAFTVLVVGGNQVLPSEVFSASTNQIVFSQDEPGRLFTLETRSTNFAVQALTVDASGVHSTNNVVLGLASTFNGQFTYALGRLFISNGNVADGHALVEVGTFERIGSLFTSGVAVRALSSRAYLYSDFSGGLYVFDTNYYYRLASRQLPNAGLGSRIVLWGDDGIAIVGAQIHLYHDSDIPAVSTPALPAPQSLPDGTLKIALPNNGWAYDAIQRRFFVSTQNGNGTLSNSVVPIDGATLTPGTPIFVGSQPASLSVSEQSRSLWVALGGQPAVRRVNLDLLNAAELVSLGNHDAFTGASTYPAYAYALAGLPGASPAFVAVRGGDAFLAPDWSETAIYDLTGQRPNVISKDHSGDSISIDDTGTQVFSSFIQQTSGGLSEFNISQNGLQLSQSFILGSDFGSRVRWGGGRLYMGSGTVLDPVTGHPLGLFSPCFTVAVDSASSVFYALADNAVLAYDATTFVLLGSFAIPGFTYDDIALVDSSHIAIHGYGEIRVIPTAKILTAVVPPPNGTPLITKTPWPGVTQLLTAANAISYDAKRGRLLASLSGGDPLAGNRLAVLNLAGLSIETSMPVGSEPGQIEPSADGQTVWLLVNGTSSLLRVDPWNQKVISTDYTGPVTSIAAAPTLPNRVAIAFFGTGKKLQVWDGTTRVSWTATVPLVRFGTTDTDLFGYDNTNDGFGLSHLVIGTSGITTGQQIGQVVRGFDFYFDSTQGLLMAFGGPILDSHTLTPWGDPGTVGRKYLDFSHNRLYVVSSENFPQDTVVRAYELSTLRALGSATLPRVGVGTLQITGCGDNAICLLMDDGTIYRITLNAFSWLPPVVPVLTTVVPGIRSLTLPAQSLRYYAPRNLLFAAVSGLTGSLGNSVVTVDPVAGQILSSVLVGSLPNKMALSADDSRLYVALEGANAVQPIDPANRRALPSFFVGYNRFGYSVPVDLSVDPTNPNTVAVARQDLVTTTPGRDAVLFDNGVPRPRTSLNPTFYLDVGCNQIAFTETGQSVLCLNTDTSSALMEALTVQSDGFVFTPSFPSQIQRPFALMRYLAGRAYFSDGTVLDLSTKSIVGRTVIPSTLPYDGRYLVVPVPLENRIYYVNSNANSNTEVLAYEMSSLRYTGSVTLPASAGTVTDLENCGGNCLAVATGAAVLFIQKDLLGTPACALKIDPSGTGFAASGGSGSFNVTVGNSCGWTATTGPNWITLNRPSAGIGSGVVNFVVSPNSGAARTAVITINGLDYRIEQAAGSFTGVPIGSLAQVASEGTWDFTFDAVNLGVSTGQARFSFAGDTGVPLPLPLQFPQDPFAAGPIVAPVLDRTLPPNSTLVVESTGPNSASALVGWGQLLGSGNISGFGIFDNVALNWHASVPLETRNAPKYFLAFDNTGALATGVAIANLAKTGASIPVIIRDDMGVQILTATVSLPSQGHISFMLNQQYSATAGKRGTVEFDTPGFGTPSAGWISVLGMRTSGTALTTLPVIASTDPSGGAVAHVTYNGGFTSVFHIVNTGTATASFTLSFFDEGGNPWAVPLLLPQSGTATAVPVLTQTLAPGALLVVQTQANAGANVSGTAQLTSTGDISGFEIFDWTTFGQEASVPLETRTPSSFLLLYDNTGNLTTGVALANRNKTAAAIGVNVYDDGGTLLQTTSAMLPAHGHVSFMLPNTYTRTANMRGMVEFVVPQGGKISVIGVRAASPGTLTTIPVLVR